MSHPLYNSETASVIAGRKRAVSSSYVTLRRQSYQQRLRLADLRKIRRRRKTFERGGQYGTGVGIPAAALIKIGKRQRPAQLKTAHLLLFRDGYRSQECFLGRCGMRGITLQQNVAADAVQDSVIAVFSSLLRERQRFIDPTQGFLRASSFRFKLSE